MRPRLFLALIAAVALASCRNPPARPAPGLGNGPPQQITGNEGLGWDQPGNPADLADIRFAVYVDGNRSQLTETSCGTTAGPAGFPCSGRLPPMSPGTHTLELSAFVEDGSNVLESPRSAPIRVVVSSGTAIARGTAAEGGLTAGRSEAQPGALQHGTVVTAADATRLRIEVLTGELHDPASVAVAPDGTLFVAERAGRVLLVRDDAVTPRPALVIDDVVAEGTGQLLAVALDPRFEATGFLFAIYTAPSRTGAPAFRIARFRRAGDFFAEQAIILDGVPAGPVRPSASLAFGPDGKLYAAFDAGGEPDSAGDLASFNGKVLRLNPDGTTPRDQPLASPVHAYPFGSPRGMAWQRDAGVLWVAEEGEEGDGRLTALVDTRPGRARVGQVFAVPGGATALALYESDRVPALRGNLLVGGGNGGILRLRVDPHDAARIDGAERLLQDAGRVEVVAVAPDGTVYFCTAGTLARLVPDVR
ncbi:MAG: hypothetical protein EHM24_25925 [Acidobacteria bacterium]|nr:MAG: hypothetical protein EHM24_25925 [Acidobacteriota bacterium]